jgi:hypothetical protein
MWIKYPCRKYSNSVTAISGNNTMQTSREKMLQDYQIESVTGER